MTIPSWLRLKKPLRVSEASLWAIKRAEREKALALESDTLRAKLNN